ncbi:homoserine O-acetyltransferase/O-succinyltransferase family protein [Fructobacillus ficulneus]|uniref:Homoserine O-acetyltransferase n=1 Tax=Fructobacillus ficulneus TaxID=157463 RepID=A0A0K8MH62_9LACO|nr:homoserine O-succinyltransferase [Fructobacillus ficulneus]GAO99807.1 putative homoserine O-succinyltransferase [Fructobacillus ficulneus]
MTANAVNGFLQQNREWVNQTIEAPRKILVWNLMPNKQNTEFQFLSLLDQLDQDVEVTFLYACSHHFKTVRQEDVESCYACWHDIQDQNFDGLIITGAPVEQLDFEDVDYWQEFQTIKAWAQDHVGQTINACWSAQAALYHDFQIPTQQLDQKLFGIYQEEQINDQSVLAQGLEDFTTPQSRHAGSVIDRQDLPEDLEIVVDNAEAGPLVLFSASHHQTYVTGHSEYQTETLDQEYRRDLKKGCLIQEPANYYPDDYYDCGAKIINTWQDSSIQLYQNWLNLIENKENSDDKNQCFSF